MKTKKLLKLAYKVSSKYFSCLTSDCYPYDYANAVQITANLARFAALADLPVKASPDFDPGMFTAPDTFDTASIACLIDAGKIKDGDRDELMHFMVWLSVTDNLAFFDKDCTPVRSPDLNYAALVVGGLSDRPLCHPQPLDAQIDRIMCVYAKLAPDAGAYNGQSTRLSLMAIHKALCYYQSGPFIVEVTQLFVNDKHELMCKLALYDMHNEHYMTTPHMTVDECLADVCRDVYKRNAKCAKAHSLYQNLLNNPEQLRAVILQPELVCWTNGQSDYGRLAVSWITSAAEMYKAFLMRTRRDTRHSMDHSEVFSDPIEVDDFMKEIISLLNALGKAQTSRTIGKNSYVTFDWFIHETSVRVLLVKHTQSSLNPMVSIPKIIADRSHTISEAVTYLGASFT